jgi:hypothetical protein
VWRAADLPGTTTQRPLQGNAHKNAPTGEL